jgi:membrane-associated phospholipid phosphatase
LARPAGRGWDALHLDAFAHAWETGRDWANPVAAMPSLHAAFSLFLVVYFFPRVRRRWARLALLSYPLAMGLTLVYLAEHWVIDLIAGWCCTGVAFGVWALIDRRRASASDRRGRHGAALESSTPTDEAATSTVDERNTEGASTWVKDVV